MTGVPFSHSLIVSTSYDASRLEIVLRAIAKMRTLPGQLIIAEDGLDGDTMRLLAGYIPEVSFPVIHVRQIHAGFRKARILNRAIITSPQDFIIFLDGDCVPHRRFLCDHLALAEVNCFTQGRRCFIAEEAIERFANKNSRFDLLVRRKLKRPLKSFRFPVPLVRTDAQYGVSLGCNFAAWRKDLQTINGFDERFCGWGREDSDLSARLFHAGCRRKTVRGQAIVFHLDHPVRSGDRLRENDKMLNKTIETRRVRAVLGLAEISNITDSTANAAENA